MEICNNSIRPPCHIHGMWGGRMASCVAVTRMTSHYRMASCVAVVPTKKFAYDIESS